MSARILLVLPAWMALAAVASAEPLTCNLSAYRAASGLTAAADGTTLTVTWDGERQQELRLRFGLTEGNVTIQTLDVRQKGGAWSAIATNIGPDFRVVSGCAASATSSSRRCAASASSSPPTSSTGSAGSRSGTRRSTCGTRRAAAATRRRPPASPISRACRASPRRSSARLLVYDARPAATVKTDGARLEIAFPGVQLGVFSGALQFTVFKGSNLIQQDVAGDDQRAVGRLQVRRRAARASTAAGARVAWRDIANNWQDYRFGGAVERRAKCRCAPPAAW